MPRKNDEYEVEITGWGADGEGVARIEDFVVFVPDALPGERISIRIVKTKKNYGYGKLLAVLSPSAMRRISPCAESARCGGCQLMHCSYPAQLSYKQNKVRQALVRIGGFSNVAVDECVGMEEPDRYRNKMIFPLGIDKGGRAVFGFYAMGSHRVVPLADCLICKEEGVRCARLILDFLNEKHIPVYDELSGTGLARRIFIRTGEHTGEVMAVLSVKGDGIPAEDELVKRLIDGVPSIKSVILNINRSKANAVLGEKNRTLWGNGFITDTIGGIRFRISPHSFYQVNPRAVKTLYDMAIEMAGLSKEERVLDLYCGIGTISLFAAKRAKEVIGVESVAQAVEDAKSNAAENGVENVRFYCGEAEKVVPGLCSGGVDVVILDPPRKGSDENTLGAILQANPKRIVYVSCEPSTLSRDLRFLCAGGEYEIRKVAPVDMFPHTSHVETVVLMSRIDK